MFRRILNIAIIVVMAAGLGMAAGVAMVSQSEPVEAASGDIAGPRICTFSQDDVLQQSAVGQKGSKRLQQLVQEARQVVANERESLAKDIQTFNAKADTLEESARQSQAKALQQRQRALKQKVQQLDARIRYTRSVVTKRINGEVNPLLDDRYKAHDCNILLASSAVLKGNPDNDLTADVIKALDAEITTIKFDLLALPEQSSEERDSNK